MNEVVDTKKESERKLEEDKCIKTCMKKEDKEIGEEFPVFDKNVAKVRFPVLAPPCTNVLYMQLS